MSIISKEIKIFFNSNFQKEKIEFDLSKLYDEIVVDGKPTKLNTTGLNKLPYFTLSVKYPLSKLLVNLKSYQERVEFFFDKKKFEKILFLNIDKTELSSNDEPSVVGENNVMVMIELLFPTKFTVINNFHTSYDHVFDNSSLNRMLINPLTQKNYSYLKLSDGKIYTFIRLVWLNDLLNHPKYKEFFDNFTIFWNWYKRETSKISNKVNDIKKKTIALIDSVLAAIKNKKKTLKSNIADTAIKTETFLIELKQKLEDGKLENLEKDKPAGYFKNYLTSKASKANASEHKIEGETEKNLKDINENITNINKTIKEESTNKQEYENLITNIDTMKKYTTSNYGEYRTFVGLKNKYVNDSFSYPKYISTNEKLKDFFNNIENEDVKRFFNIFEKIYNIYIAGTSDKLTSEDEALLKQIMNTSVNIIYPDSNSYLSSYSNSSYYEIYIMADFIQGKVDDKNANEIFCPYVGDYLGNMFELLFQLQLYGKTDKQDIYRWDVTRNRVSFSIENMELKAGEMKDQLVKKPLENQTNNQNINDKPINKANNKINVSKLINDVYSNNKELNEIIDKLKKYQIYINESSLLNDIKKYNESLYNIIAETYNDESNYNVKLSKKINDLKTKYEGDNKFNKDTIDSKKEVNNYDPNKIIKIEQEISMNEFYIEILKKLYEVENKKNKNISVGGTKKRRFSKKKYQTRKTRHA
jgi:hypothetical protein